MLRLRTRFWFVVFSPGSRVLCILLVQAYDTGCRQHWWKATSGDWRGFVLREQMCGIDFDRLTRVERENTRWESGAAAGATTTSTTTSTGGGGKGSGYGKAQPKDFSAVQCLGCGQYGHYVRNCPQQRTQPQANNVFQQTGKATQPPPPPPLVVPQQLAIGNGAMAQFGKGGKQPNKGKGGKFGKGKR
jgi:hypothetical protein